MLNLLKIYFFCVSLCVFFFDLSILCMCLNIILRRICVQDYPVEYILTYDTTSIMCVSRIDENTYMNLSASYYVSYLFNIQFTFRYCRRRFINTITQRLLDSLFPLFMESITYLHSETYIHISKNTNVRYTYLIKV